MKGTRFGVCSFNALCPMYNLQIYSDMRSKVAGAVRYRREVPICILQQYTATSHVKSEVCM